MKLYCSPTSPYARKARAVARECGLADRIEEVVTAPRDNSTGFHDKNPLARIPVLETDDGEILFDSPVICEYLDALGKGGLLPPEGAARWTALRRQAVGDGIMDAAVPLRAERLRPRQEQSAEWLKRYEGMIRRTLDALEREADRLPQQADLGTLAIGCALGYLDFRFDDLGWRQGRSRLAAWFERFGQRPSLQATVPG